MSHVARVDLDKAVNRRRREHACVRRDCRTENMYLELWMAGTVLLSSLRRLCHLRRETYFLFNVVVNKVVNVTILDP